MSIIIYNINTHKGRSDPNHTLTNHGHFTDSTLGMTPHIDSAWSRATRDSGEPGRCRVSNQGKLSLEKIHLPEGRVESSRFHASNRKNS